MRLFIRTALLWLLLPWLSLASVAATAPGASAIAPPGVPIDWYLDVPAHAEGPAIDPNKGTPQPLWTIETICGALTACRHSAQEGRARISLRHLPEKPRQ
jgi:hypothetical protein